MKLKNNILFIAISLLACVGITSCSDDDLGASIFDATDHPLDRSAYTFPLDTFIKKNFQEPYNMRYVYKMEDIGSDMEKNLVPATYQNSADMAVLIKYLWYDAYEAVSQNNPTFMKEYSPRIIQTIGSPSYNASTGSITVGDAAGGVKINLYNLNNMPAQLTANSLNDMFFQTLHHEFTHILDQHIVHPTSFNTISTGRYEANSWSELRDSVMMGNGFVSAYASSSTSEDWAETMATYIVKDSVAWAQLLDAASYEWEDLEDVDDKWFASLTNVPKFDRDTIGYKYTTQSGKFKVYRKKIERSGTSSSSYAKLDKDGKVTYLHTSGVNGAEVILQKLNLVREWLKNNFNLDLDQLRAEVQKRQFVTNPDGTFKKDAYGNLVDKLTSPSEENPNITVIQALRNQIEAYKSLQTNK